MTTNELTYNLSGYVRHQGLPVAAVVVSIYDLYQIGTSVPSVGDVLVGSQKTGARGEFTFPVRAGLYRVEVTPDSSTRFLRHITPEVRVANNTTCNINLGTGYIMEGTVLTSSGQNVRRCEVVALGIEPSSYRSTSPVDELGQFTLILPRGKYHIACRSTSYESREGSKNMGGKSESGRGGSGDSGGDGALRGKNGDSGDGDGGKSGDSGSGDGGKSDVHRESNAANTCPSQSFVSTKVQVIDLDGDSRLDVELPPLVYLTGEVKDVFGQAVVNAQVTISPGKAVNQSGDAVLVRELDLSARSRTDEDGRFTSGVRPGKYDILIEPEDSAVLFSLRESAVEINADEKRVFTVSEGFRLRGQVIYEDGPLSHCLVRVQSLDRKQDFMARTDQQGQFSIAVPGGNYKMVVSAHPKDAPTITINDAEYNGLAPWTRMVVVGGDTHVAVRMQQGNALYGRISDDAGNARPGVRVSVFLDSERALDGDGKGGAIASGITDGEGRYCLFLSPGTYWLVVHKDFANARMVEIEQEPVNVDISWHGWCQLRFEVVGEDGQCVPRCRVAYAPFGSSDLESIYDEEGKDVESRADSPSSELPRGYLLTGDDGVCRLTVPSGVYTLRFTPPLDGSYEPKLIRQLSISNDLTRRITLSLKRDTVSEEVGEGAGVS